MRVGADINATAWTSSAPKVRYSPLAFLCKTLIRPSASASSAVSPASADFAAAVTRLMDLGADPGRATDANSAIGLLFYGLGGSDAQAAPVSFLGAARIALARAGLGAMLRSPSAPSLRTPADRVVWNLLPPDTGDVLGPEVLPYLAVLCGADPSQPWGLSGAGFSYLARLVAACNYRQLELVLVALRNTGRYPADYVNAAVKIREGTDMSLLQVLFSLGHTRTRDSVEETAQLLLDNGADPDFAPRGGNPLDFFNRRPLLCSAIAVFNPTLMAAFLTTAGARIGDTLRCGAKDTDSDRPAKYPEITILRAAVDQAALRSIPLTGDVHSLAAADPISVVRLLLRSGASVTAETTAGGFDVIYRTLHLVESFLLVKWNPLAYDALKGAFARRLEPLEAQQRVAAATRVIVLMKQVASILASSGQLPSGYWKLTGAVDNFCWQADIRSGIPAQLQRLRIASQSLPMIHQLARDAAWGRRKHMIAAREVLRGYT